MSTCSSLFDSQLHHLKSERSAGNVGAERGHDLTIVSHASEESGKSRNGARDDLFRKESEDSKHSKTSVVDLSYQTLGLGGLVHALGELERIVEVERNRVRKEVVEVRVVTRLSSGHVVSVALSGKLTPELKERDESEDLPLGGVRDGIPESRGVGLRREASSVHLHGPRELDSVGVDNVSNEGEHSNTSVLDLSVTEETDGGLVAGSPELGIGEVERIVVSNHGVQFLGQNLKVGLSNGTRTS